MSTTPILLPAGLTCARHPTLKAFEISYKNDFSVSPSTYYATSRGSALSAWMKENCEYDFIECAGFLRIRRQPESDFYQVLPDNSALGRSLLETYTGLSFDDKLSLLSFGGLSINSIHSAIFKESNGYHRGHGLFNFRCYFSLSRHTGWVRDLWEERPLFDTFSFTEHRGFRYFPSLAYCGLNTLGEGLFLLALQGFAEKMNKHIDKVTLLGWLDSQRRQRETMQKTCDSEQPKIFHKMLPRKINSEQLAAMPCLIYSGQWGVYWRDLSGYCNKREEARQFQLRYAVGHVGHCGDEKAIYIALLSANECHAENVSSDQPAQEQEYEQNTH